MPGQLAIWWLFHTSALFWQVVFPLHARSMSGKIKYIHITCVILGVLLPLIPIISSMVDFALDLQNQTESASLPSSSKNSFLSGGMGFRSTRFPAILCTGTDPDIIFYTLILPMVVILASGCTMIITIFWSVHRVSHITDASYPHTHPPPPPPPPPPKELV